MTLEYDPKKSLLIDYEMIEQYGRDEAIMYRFLFLNYLWKLQPNKWGFQMTSKEIQTKLGFSYFQSNSILKRLQSFGLIDFQVMGLPASQHIKIIKESLPVSWRPKI